MSTDEKGLAPIVNGERVPVFHYLDSFHEGYHAAYQQALNSREELAAALRNAPSDMPIRIIVYGTQEYFDIIMRLYNHDSLATAENYQKSLSVRSFPQKTPSRTAEPLSKEVALSDAEAKKISEVITENFTDSLQNFYEYHKSYDFAFDYAPQLGEADGIAGIIRALSLLKRYSPHSQFEDTI